jgi:hypothetical protein
MALFSSAHLLLLCKRPSLRSAWSEGLGFHWIGVVQPATRAAARGGGTLIRKMRPFEESHVFALCLQLCKQLVYHKMSLIILAKG